MIVLGLSASLIAGMTLFAIALLNRIEFSREKLALRRVLTSPGQLTLTTLTVQGFDCLHGG